MEGRGGGGGGGAITSGPDHPSRRFRGNARPASGRRRRGRCHRAVAAVVGMTTVLLAVDRGSYFFAPSLARANCRTACTRRRSRSCARFSIQIGHSGNIAKRRGPGAPMAPSSLRTRTAQACRAAMNECDIARFLESFGRAPICRWPRASTSGVGDQAWLPHQPIPLRPPSRLTRWWSAEQRMRHAQVMTRLALSGRIAVLVKMTSLCLGLPTLEEAIRSRARSRRDAAHAWCFGRS